MNKFFYWKDDGKVGCALYGLLLVLDRRVSIDSVKMRK